MRRGETFSMLGAPSPLPGRHAIMRIWQGVLALSLFLTGALAVAQWRSQEPFRAQTELPSYRTQDLALLIKRQEEARLALEAEVGRLRERVAAYRAAVARGHGAAAAMARELEHYRLVLGLVPVTGPGVVVRLQSPAAATGVVLVQVRAGDLAGLVNELWSAGAEAVAVNGARILATTGFQDRADGLVMVGSQAARPPFTIAAIGEPLTLHGALSLRGGFVEGLQSIGLRVTVQRRPSLTLDAHKGPLLFRQARPLAGPEPR